jgi:hypothetical protein
MDVVSQQSGDQHYRINSDLFLPVQILLVRICLKSQIFLVF